MSMNGLDNSLLEDEQVLILQEDGGSHDEMTKILEKRTSCDEEVQKLLEEAIFETDADADADADALEQDGGEDARNSGGSAEEAIVIHDEDDAENDCAGVDENNPELFQHQLSQEQQEHLEEEVVQAIALLPPEKRRAYEQAFEKAPRVVQIESPISRFLTVCQRNIWAAAERLCQYWQTRLDVFGFQQFHKPMSLFSPTTALCAEAKGAIFSGSHVPLPTPDRHGRMVYLQNRQKYAETPELSDVSTFRFTPRRSKAQLLFYILQELSEKPQVLERGFVTVCSCLTNSHAEAAPFDSPTTPKNDRTDFPPLDLDSMILSQPQETRQPQQPPKSHPISLDKLLGSNAMPARLHRCHVMVPVEGLRKVLLTNLAVMARRVSASDESLSSRFHFHTVNAANLMDTLQMCDLTQMHLPLAATNSSEELEMSTPVLDQIWQTWLQERYQKEKDMYQATVAYTSSNNELNCIPPPPTCPATGTEPEISMEGEGEGGDADWYDSIQDFPSGVDGEWMMDEMMAPTDQQNSETTVLTAADETSHSEKYSETASTSDSNTYASAGKVLTDQTAPNGNLPSPVEDSIEVEKLQDELYQAIYMLPESQRGAYEEAQERNPRVVEIETPPGRFLKAHEYDFWAAAQGICEYWKRRKYIYGGERFIRPLNLSGQGAVTPLIVDVIKNGPYSILTERDADGGFVLFYNTDKFYASPVLSNANPDCIKHTLQVIFYFLQVMSESDGSEGINEFTALVASAFGGEPRGNIFYRISSTLMKALKSPGKREPINRVDVLILSECVPVRLRNVHVLQYTTNTISSRMLGASSLGILQFMLRAKDSLLFPRVKVHSVGSREAVVRALQPHGLSERHLPAMVGGDLPGSTTTSPGGRKYPDVTAWFHERREVEQERYWFLGTSEVASSKRRFSSVGLTDTNSPDANDEDLVNDEDLATLVTSSTKRKLMEIADLESEECFQKQRILELSCQKQRLEQQQKALENQTAITKYLAHQYEIDKQKIHKFLCGLFSSVIASHEVGDFADVFLEQVLLFDGRNPANGKFVFRRTEESMPNFPQHIHTALHQIMHGQMQEEILNPFEPPADLYLDDNADQDEKQIATLKAKVKFLKRRNADLKADEVFLKSTQGYSSHLLGLFETHKAKHLRAAAAAIEEIFAACGILEKATHRQNDDTEPTPHHPIAVANRLFAKMAWGDTGEMSCTYFWNESTLLVQLLIAEGYNVSTYPQPYMATSFLPPPQNHAASFPGFFEHMKSLLFGAPAPSPMSLAAVGSNIVQPKQHLWSSSPPQQQMYHG